MLKTVGRADHQGEIYLWPIRLPDADGKLDDWNQSALDYARQTGIWQRVAANMHIGEYDQYTILRSTRHVGDCRDLGISHYWTAKCMICPRAACGLDCSPITACCWCSSCCALE